MADIEDSKQGPASEEDNIISLTESTCISVESLEDRTFYEDDNDEFVATLSEMSEKDTRLNYSDDEPVSYTHLTLPTSDLV